MSAIFNFLKEHFKQIFWFNVFFMLIGSLVFPSLISLLIQKQNFIYLLSISPLIGQYAIYGVCIFIFLCLFTMIKQISSNF